MTLFSRLLRRLGYVKLGDYGLALAGGQVVPVYSGHPGAALQSSPPLSQPSPASLPPCFDVQELAPAAAPSPRFSLPVPPPIPSAAAPALHESEIREGLQPKGDLLSSDSGATVVRNRDDLAAETRSPPPRKEPRGSAHTIRRRTREKRFPLQPKSQAGTVPRREIGALPPAAATMIVSRLSVLGQK